MSEKVKIVLVFSLICSIWGSTWLAIRIGLESLTPLYSSGFRFLLASLLIYLWMRFKRIELQKDKISIRFYLTMGLFTFIIPFAFIYWAEQFVPSGLASVLFAVYPFFIVLFSYFIIPSERIGYSKLIGVVIGFAGILVIFWDDLGGNITSYLTGMFAIVIGGILQAAIAVLIKRYGQHLNPLTMNFIPMTIAGFSLLALGIIIEDFNTLRFNADALLSIAYLGIFGSIVTFTSYFWLLKRVNVILLSLVAFITPIVALILGWLTYHEALTAYHFWGSMLVLTGLLWANTKGFTRLKNRRLIKPA
ncbi:MAG TPA: EamA family transporter [Ignavibacteriaceae bacterium]|nr:EamA family transporter [Ignavibacteriaceae bacterium]